MQQVPYQVRVRYPYSLLSTEEIEGSDLEKIIKTR